MKIKTIFLGTILLFLSVNKVECKIKLPALFTDNMVLQQQSEVPFWGESTPYKKIIISTSWNKKTYETFSDSLGQWKAKISTPVFGGPYTIEISDGKNLRIQNVMIGEVWLCSGQSNMEMPLADWGKVMNYEKEISNAEYPDIRLFTVQKNISSSPLSDIEAKYGGWVSCSPKTVAEFSSVAYFFGRNLYEKLKVPIGLINSSWGGTVAEAWTSADYLKNMPDFTNAVAEVQKKQLSTSEIKEKYKKDSISWQIVAQKTDRGYQNYKPVWANSDFDDSSWKEMKIPSNWEEQGLPGFDGVVWFRKKIDIPASWQHKPLVLNLDVIDDNDIAYFNGIEIGKTIGWNLTRKYTIPASLVKKGEAIITVRVFDTGGGGGIYGKENNIRITSATGQTLPLSGKWRYKIGFNLNEIPAAPVIWNNPNQATVLFNAMINPLIPFTIKGVIWYQGESNSDRAYQYRELFPLMIKDWRNHWKSDFAFYFVQLANFMPVLEQPEESSWAELRDAQLNTLHLENTGMAVAIDIGDTKDIHPKNKQEVGSRLSLIARAKTYKEEIAFSGPIYDNYRIEGNKIRIDFKYSDSGLKTKNKEQLKGFAIAGLDHKFHWADARIDGNEVIVSCEEVEIPLAVRYAWSNNPICNLYNADGLPASPFRTDDWQSITLNK